MFDSVASGVGTERDGTESAQGCHRPEAKVLLALGGGTLPAEESRKRRIRRAEMAALVALTLGASAGAGVAKIQWKAAVQTVAHLDVGQAVDLIKAGNESDTLVHLAQSLRIQPECSQAAILTFSLLTAQAWQVPKWMLTENTSGPVKASFSRDGLPIVGAPDDKAARVWDAGTRRPLTPPLRHDGIVWSAAAFSPGRLARRERRLTTRRLRVWDASTGAAAYAAINA